MGENDLNELQGESAPNRILIRRKLRKALLEIHGGRWVVDRMQKYPRALFRVFPEVFFQLKFGNRAVSMQVNNDDQNTSEVEFLYKTLEGNSSMVLLDIFLPNEHYPLDSVARRVVEFFREFIETSI